jgi:hypothetical protein
MSNLNITSADAIFTITVANLLNAPFTLANFATDKAWDTAEREIAETQMSIDGYLNAGWVANPVDQTISLSAASDSCTVFESIVAAQDIARTLYRIGAQITVTATGRKYTCVNGVIRTVNPIPSAGKVFDPRTFAVRWQAVTPAGI